jgi:hypothetical protein
VVNLLLNLIVGGIFKFRSEQAGLKGLQTHEGAQAIA